MRNRLLVLFLASFALSANATYLAAEDLTGRWGVGGIAQASTAVGIDIVQHQSGDVGTDFGGLVRYGLTPHWGLGLSYEDINLGHRYRIEPITLQGIYSFFPERRWTPIALIGAGAAASDISVTSHYNNMSAKAGLGLEYFFCHYFSAAALVNYHYVSETGDAIHQVHALTAGLMATMYFGRAEKSTPTAAAPPPVAPAAISLALNPASATLSEGQTQQLTPSVSGTSNTAVAWSLAPNLGTVSNSGLYAAPATIAIRQDVVVTAKSVADPSKSASSTITLQPGKATEKVSITLNVLFDTAKSVVKPAYDSEIKKVADFMTTYTGTNAEIEGHTDSMGDAAYNQGLSQRRADAVRQYLVDKFHIDASRLTAKGYGPTRPIADNKSAEGRAKNRRVVATLTAVKS